MQKLLPALAALAALSLASCGSNDNGGIKGLSQPDADRLNSARTKFETSEDPPFTAQTHFSAGQLAETQGAPVVAIEQYRAALKLDAKHLPSLYRLGVLYAQTRQYPAAIATWEQYIKQSNGDATGYANLGYTHELASDTTKAQDAYRKGINADPYNEPCRINLGLLLVRLGQQDAGVRQLSAVLPPAKVHYNLASIYEQIGQKQKAAAEYRLALQLDPTLAPARMKLASIEE